MKKLIPVLFIALIAVIASSCKKDEGNLPTISLKTTSGYTSSDKTVAKNTSVKFGISAAKAEELDVLKTFNVAVVYDGATTSTDVENNILSGTDVDAYDHDVTITTRNVAGTEKYTFTVVNRDGLKNSKTVTLTVN